MDRDKINRELVNEKVKVVDEKYAEYKANSSKANRKALDTAIADRNTAIWGQKTKPHKSGKGAIVLDVQNGNHGMKAKMKN